MVRISDLLDAFLDSGLVPYCGQDGSRTQVPQHHIDPYQYKNHIIPIILGRLDAEMKVAEKDLNTKLDDER